MTELTLLTNEQIEEIAVEASDSSFGPVGEMSEWHTFEQPALREFVGKCIAEFCRINGLTITGSQS